MQNNLKSDPEEKNVICNNLNSKMAKNVMFVDQSKYREEKQNEFFFTFDSLEGKLRQFSMFSGKLLTEIGNYQNEICHQMIIAHQRKKLYLLTKKTDGNLKNECFSKLREFQQNGEVDCQDRMNPKKSYEIHSWDEDDVGDILHIVLSKDEKSLFSAHQSDGSLIKWDTESRELQSETDGINWDEQNTMHLSEDGLYLSFITAEYLFMFRMVKLSSENLYQVESKFIEQQNNQKTSNFYGFEIDREIIQKNNSAIHQCKELDQKNTENNSQYVWEHLFSITNIFQAQILAVTNLPNPKQQGPCIIFCQSNDQIILYSLVSKKHSIILDMNDKHIQILNQSISRDKEYLYIYMLKLNNQNEQIFENQNNNFGKRQYNLWNFHFRTKRVIKEYRFSSNAETKLISAFEK